MYSPNIIVYTTAVLSFVFSFVGFYFLNQRNEELAPTKNTPFLIFLSVIAISFVALYMLLPVDTDFIYAYSLRQIVVLLVGSMAIYFSSRVINKKIFHLLINILCCIGVCVFIPNDFVLTSQISPFFSKVLLALCLFVFSYFYPIINDIDTLTTIETSSIALGIFFLSFVGGSPLLIGAYGLSLGMICMAFLAFNRYPSQLNFIPAGCQALGFVVGTLMIQLVVEGSSLAVLIFSLFFWVELISSVGKKLVNWKQNLPINTYINCYQANLSGYPPYIIAGHVLRLQIVLVIMGCFVVYAPEGLSIPLFSLIVTVWYISKVKNWQTANKTIRELNQDLMNDIKNNINIIKERINKD